MGGGGGVSLVEPLELGALRGISFDPLVTPSPVSLDEEEGAFWSLELELALSGEAASGWESARGLGGSGGGMGREADGASGISSGFCWANRAPASITETPSIGSHLVFLLIPTPFIFLLSFFRYR
jgi:hypothetical protein